MTPGDEPSSPCDENAIQAASNMSQPQPVEPAPDRLTPTEEATANAVEADFQALFDRWSDRGFPRNVTVPMALIVAVDAAKRAGVSFESAVETLKMIWFGSKEPS